MTQDQLESVLKSLNAKIDKEGWFQLPEGSLATLHIAKDGASLSLARVDGVKLDGDLLLARTPKKELFASLRADVLAVAFDPGSSLPARRAGF